MPILDSKDSSWDIDRCLNGDTPKPMLALPSTKAQFHSMMDIILTDEALA
jgi:hypothetical protein